MEKRKNHRRFIRLGVLIAMLAAVFALGYGTRVLHEGKRAQHVQIRLEDYRYIQPLLECSGGDHPRAVHPDLLPLKSAVLRTVDSHIGDGSARTIAVYFRDLRSGSWFGVNDQVPFTPASLMKVPLMMAVLKHAELDSGLLRKKLRHTGENTRRFQGVPPEKTLRPGAWYTVDDLLYRMIAYSDNDAALLLADHFGTGVLDKTLKDLSVPVGGGKTGMLVTVRDFTAFFRVLFNASYLSHTLSERALDYLARSGFDDGIRGGVPADTPVASKFGEYSAGSYQLHEFGIIYYPGHPYLLGIVTKDGSQESLSHVMREISQAVFREIDRQHDGSFS